MSFEWKALNPNDSNDLTYVDAESGRILGGVAKNFNQESWCAFSPFAYAASFLTQEQAKTHIEKSLLPRKSLGHPGAAESVNGGKQ